MSQGYFLLIFVPFCIQSKHIYVPFVSNNELNQISSTLWQMDKNRAIPDLDFELDTSGEKYFKRVNEEIFKRATYEGMITLFDNYNPRTGEPDPECDLICKQEQDDFIDSVMSTDIMRRLWEFLADRGLASLSEQGFKQQLKNYWFLPYSRNGRTVDDSSGFEHVFVGDISRGKVKGFHNWVRYYLEEKANNAKLDDTVKVCKPSTQTLIFKWFNYKKPYGGFYVGSSPEVELALYTLCFLTRTDQICKIELNEEENLIQTYRMRSVEQKTVGTAYPKC